MRLTEKHKDGKYYTSGENIQKAYPKLGQLEDIEEELGIDLITLFKALKNGIWCKLENGSIEHHQDYISNRSYGFVCIEQEYISYYECCLGEMRKEMNFYLKDYGKTWALTKDEIPNDN